MKFLKLLSSFLEYRDFVHGINSMKELTEADKLELKSYRSERIEEAVYDVCKQRLYKEFAEGAASRDYVAGYLQALAVHRSITKKKQ